MTKTVVSREVMQDEDPENEVEAEYRSANDKAPPSTPSFSASFWLSGQSGVFFRVSCCPEDGDRSPGVHDVLLFVKSE